MTASARFAPVVGVLALCAVAPVSVPAQDYEAPPKVSPERILSPALLASGNHRVSSDVRNRGNWLEFQIESDFGNFHALSIPMVALRVHEIRTLAQAVDRFKRNNEKLADTLRGQLTIGADSFVDILSPPLSTTIELVGPARGNVQQALKELGEIGSRRTEDQTVDRGVYEKLESGDPVFDAHKRNVASQLNLDVYSTNPRVQEFLDTLARARSSGQQSAGVVTVSLPRDQEVKVAGGRIGAETRAAMTHNTINQLYARNLERLLAGGVEPDLANDFLSHPLLSPRHKTAITDHAVYLKGVGNPGAVLQCALVTRSEAEALAYVEAAKMLSSYHERIEPLRELIAAGHVVLAITRDSRLLVVLPVDVIYWDEKAQRVFSGLAEYAKSRRFRSLDLISNGMATEMALAKLERLGISTRHRFLNRQ